MSQSGFVYGIFLESGACVYVGATGDPRRRWREHRSKIATSGDSPLYASLREVDPKGIEFKILDSASSQEGLHAAERRWVKLMRNRGETLLNEATGGPGSMGYKYPMPGVRTRDRGTQGVMSDEQREKISAALLGRPKPDGFGEKISAANRGDRHPMAKLTREQALEVLRRASSGEEPRAIAADYGINATQVRRIRRGDRWKDLPRDEGKMGGEGR